MLNLFGCFLFSNMSVGDGNKFEKALNELAERIVESALSEASLVIPKFSPVSSNSGKQRVKMEEFLLSPFSFCEK